MTPPHLLYTFPGPLVPKRRIVPHPRVGITNADFKFSSLATMNCVILSLFAILSFVAVEAGQKQTINIHGLLLCESAPYKDARVTLSKSRFFSRLPGTYTPNTVCASEKDNLLSDQKSAADGKFTVEGTASDLKGNAYLKISHTCNNKAVRP